MVQPVWITLDLRVVCVCHSLSFRVGTFHDIHDQYNHVTSASPEFASIPSSLHLSEHDMTHFFKILYVCTSGGTLCTLDHICRDRTEFNRTSCWRSLETWLKHRIGWPNGTKSWESNVYSRYIYVYVHTVYVLYVYIQCKYIYIDYIVDSMIYVWYFIQTYSMYRYKRYTCASDLWIQDLGVPPAMYYQQVFVG